MPTDIAATFVAKWPVNVGSSRPIGSEVCVCGVLRVQMILAVICCVVCMFVCVTLAELL